MKIKSLLALLLIFTLATTACEKNNTPETPNNTENPDTPNGDENKDDDENKEEDNNSWIDNPTTMPEATYVINEHISASVYEAYADGMRNDYISFYQETTGWAIFFDIYTDESNTMLPTGRYVISDDKLNSLYREYCYFTPYTNSDLYRFTEGWLEVIADGEHSSGFPYHKIRGYAVMENGESVSVEFEGTLIAK